MAHLLLETQHRTLRVQNSFQARFCISNYLGLHEV